MGKEIPNCACWEISAGKDSKANMQNKYWNKAGILKKVCTIAKNIPMT